MTDQRLELMPPDISAHAAGNVGLPYVWRFEANRPGPHVCVTAIVHGNELCGAIMVDRLLRHGLRPERGTLSFVFANVAAFERFSVIEPEASRFVDEDFNRVWDVAVLDGDRRTVELERARALRPFYDTVDLLLDIHSMQHGSPPLALCGPLEKGRRFAREIAAPATIMSDAGHAAGRRLRDYAGFGDPASPRNAMLIECGQHWRADSVSIAHATVTRFLATTGAIGSAAARALGTPLPSATGLVEVTEAITIRTDDFRFVGDYTGMESIAAAGTVIAHDGTDPVRTPYPDCVLVMPSRRTRKGQTAVRLGRFVA
jgi:predicted deacylase